MHTHRHVQDIAVKKIQECVRKYGVADVRNFEMVPLPPFADFDVGKM